MVIVRTEWLEYEEEDKPSCNTFVMANAGNIVFNKNENCNNIEWKQNRSGVSQECARIVLHCQPNSHPFQTRTLFLEPNSEVKVGRSIARSRVSENNAIFDCKVLSRNHAVLWFSDGKFYVKDTRSSNGTFINERRIEQSEPETLNSGDIIKFGVDVIENSRKEVHGCIIACAKLYTPDGKEVISDNFNRNKSGEDTISLDELHRLQHFIQEASQREKILEIKLHDVQAIIETTRRNTSSCWQAMIDEDKLLNRIDILENKLQYLQKNVPEDRLKSEILKLQEDKCVYQNSAKEALRKVYQERMDALQKLTTIERALCNSEDECSLLRDQLLRTQQNLQEVSCRLTRLESESKEQKNKSENDHNELQKEENEGLNVKLKEKEEECQKIKSQINLLLSDKKMLQEQLAYYEHLDNDQKHKSVTSKSAILKWFENSELSQKEDSAEIIQAICNDFDSKEDNSYSSVNREQLKEKLSSLQQQISALESGMAKEELGDELDIISAPSLSDGNQNIEMKCISKDLLKSCTLSIIDIYKDLRELTSDITELRGNAVHSEHCVDVEEKLNSVQKELKDLQLEMQARPSHSQIVEEISANSKLHMEINSLRETVMELESDIVTLQNDKVLLEEELKKQKIVIERKDISLQTKLCKDSKENVLIGEGDDLVMLNSLTVQQEEELITWKEKYQIITSENINLRNEITGLKLRIDNFQRNFFAKCISYGILFIAIFCYLLFSYF